jgi:hypothetical protein
MAYTAAFARTRLAPSLDTVETESPPFALELVSRGDEPFAVTGPVFSTEAALGGLATGRPNVFQHSERSHTRLDTAIEDARAKVFHADGAQRLEVGNNRSCCHGAVSKIAWNSRNVRLVEYRDNLFSPHIKRSCSLSAVEAQQQVAETYNLPTKSAEMISFDAGNRSAVTSMNVPSSV